MTVSFGDWSKMELKVGKILEAEKVEGTDKLLKMKVDTGEERTIASAIAEWYTPEDLVGTEIIVLTNLEPKPMKGVMSEGMLLATESGDGKWLLVRPDKEVPAGSKVM